MKKPVEILLAGDVNLMGITPASAPFADLRARLRSADFTFVNLECCLFDGPPDAEGYYAPAQLAGQALQDAGIGGVGVANNVNHGRQAITGSLARLGELGIPFTGAGRDATQARAPLIVERGGCRVGILQRTAVYWPVDHEATATAPGVATIAAHTAYRQPSPTQRRPGLPPANRPGLPPVIETWADPDALQTLTRELRALRQQVDIVVASFHWGLFDEVLAYMTDYAHAAVDAGADIVVGHGPHDHVLPIEVRNERPIFYNLGALSFRHGPSNKTFHDWVGLLVRFAFEPPSNRTSFTFVRQDADLTIRTMTAAEAAPALEALVATSSKLGTRLDCSGPDVVVCTDTHKMR